MKAEWIQLLLAERVEEDRRQQEILKAEVAKWEKDQAFLFNTFLSQVGVPTSIDTLNAIRFTGDADAIFDRVPEVEIDGICFQMPERAGRRLLVIKYPTGTKRSSPQAMHYTTTESFKTRYELARALEEAEANCAVGRDE